MTITLNGTTGITLPNGSASAPAATGSDTDTGIVYGTNTVQVATGGTTAVTVDSSQNVGVGTTTPQGKLDVRGILAIANSNLSYWALDRNDSDGSLTFSDSTTERMRIDSSGNLLVGTTSLNGTEKLNVTTTASGGNRGICNFYNSSATSTTKIANRLIRLSANASGADNCIEFTDNVANNYYFGGNNGGAYVMANSNGVRLSSGGTSWASDSDERVKDIIEPITDAANKVSTLRAVIGKYKTDAEGTRRSFLIAQDVQAVLPEAVVAQEDEIGTLSLAYTDTIPLLVAAIQEQQAIITDLKARIETLENK